MRVLQAMLSLATLLSAPRLAFAGMPAVVFHEVAKLRLEVISFFLVGLIISAAVVFGIWNFLRRDFAWLPRLSFLRAFALVILWGLLFVVVLTMISGARELMTPGAWVRDGATYKLMDAPQPISDLDPPDPYAERRRQLTRLYYVLREFAGAHDGRFPTEDEWKSLSADRRVIPDLSRMDYIYMPGRSLSGDSKLLAYEPVVFGDDPFALFIDGEIRQLPFEEVFKLRKDGAK